MARWQYYLNALLWGINSGVWAYTGQGFMAVACAAVTVGAVVMARRADAWSYR
jgi:hypothetical protein